MKKIVLALTFGFLFSCGNKKDVLLPKSDRSVVTDVVDHSPIYIFFKMEGTDTIADVNRKNSIISTNWLVNIDKRLPLAIAIPEVIKLQEKKRKEKAHKNEKAENYYSYADSIGKNLAFIPFTYVYYKMERPTTNATVYFRKNNVILINGIAIEKKELAEKLAILFKEDQETLILGFDKHLDFGSYIQYKVILEKYINSSTAAEEFIY